MPERRPTVGIIANPRRHVWDAYYRPGKVTVAYRGVHFFTVRREDVDSYTNLSTWRRWFSTYQCTFDVHVIRDFLCR